MNKLNYFWAACGLAGLLSCGSCGSRAPGVDGGAAGDPQDGAAPPVPRPVAVSVEALPGSSTAGISYRCLGSRLIVNFSELPAQGQFVRVALPAGLAVGELSWAGNRDAAGSPAVLALAIPVSAGCELGVVPLATYGAGCVTAAAELHSAGHAATAAPAGAENAVADVFSAPAAEGKVWLGWTQHNAGDYNFDGVVDIEDMQAVAALYGAKVDRASAEARQLPEYWVDGDADGVVGEGDLAAILSHYGAELIGYNVRRNAVLLPGPEQGAPTVASSAAQRTGTAPPVYKLELDGVTTDLWAVTAVGPGGVEGATGTADPYQADLVVHVTINGMELLDLAGTAPGEASLVKFGTRVIDPIEDVGRPQGVAPVSVIGSTSIYADLPLGQPLLLDVRYLPVVDLETGTTREPAALRQAAASVDDPALVQITAIPFMLAAGSGLLQLDAKVEISANPAGGYFVTLAARQTTNPYMELSASSRLACADGVLRCDADANGLFDDEVAFSDDDRDQVSNQRLVLAQDSRRYDPVQLQLLLVRGNRGDYFPQLGYITLANPVVLNSPEQLQLASAPLRLYELTEFAGDLDPNSWTTGLPVSLEVLRMHDPSGTLADAYWVNRVEQLDSPASPGTAAALTASRGLAGRIDLEWVTVPGYSAFRLERLAVHPGPPGRGPAHPETTMLFAAGDPPYYSDVFIVPNVDYHYKYYGLNESAQPVLLGEDVGRAVQGMPAAQQPNNISRGEIAVLQQGRLVLSADGALSDFVWDGGTLWLLENGKPGSVDAFQLGDPVEVLWLAYGNLRYAMQVVLNRGH